MIAALMPCYMSHVCRAEPAQEVEGYFQETVRPILTTYCFDCHAQGAEEGGLSLDNAPSDRELIQNHELWWAVLKNLRAGIMPPADQDRPSAEKQKQVTDWIKTSGQGDTSKSRRLPCRICLSPCSINSACKPRVLVIRQAISTVSCV